MSGEDLRSAFGGSPISWSALIAVALAIITGVFGYGQMSQRVEYLEDQLSNMQPIVVMSKLAVIEADGKRAAQDIGSIQRDLAEVRRQLSQTLRGQGRDRDTIEP